MIQISNDDFSKILKTLQYFTSLREVNRKDGEKKRIASLTLKKLRRKIARMQR